MRATHLASPPAEADDFATGPLDGRDDRAIAIVERAIASLISRGAGLTVDDIVVVESAQTLDEVLVQYEDAADPCSSPGWRARVVSVVGSPGPREIVVVVGGLIRSTDPYRSFVGYTCRQRADDGSCSMSEDGAAVVLIDGGGGPPDSLEVTVAHEVAHALGLEHADLTHPFGSALVRFDDSPGERNLMRSDVDQSREEGSPRGRLVSLAEVALTGEQIDAITD